MTKKRNSFSLDPEVDAYLSRDEVNASGLVNKLVKQHMNGGSNTNDEIRRLRREQVQSEIESLEDRLNNKQSELETIQSVEKEARGERHDSIDSRLEELETVAIEIDESHPSVEGLAREHFNGDTEAALEAMQDRNEELEVVPGRYL